MRHYDENQASEDRTDLGTADSGRAHAPVALFIIGPGAVGKYTVGRQIARKLGEKWALCHNHQTIEVAYDMYPGADGNVEIDWILVEKMRETIDAHLVDHGRNIIYTNVVRFDHPIDRSYFTSRVIALRAAGYRVCVLCLCAPLGERMKRNVMPDRLAAKPSKRNVEQSEKFMMREMEQNVLEYPTKEDIERIFICDKEDIYIIDTVGKTAEQEADEAIDVLGLRLI